MMSGPLAGIQNTDARKGACFCFEPQRVRGRRPSFHRPPAARKTAQERRRAAAAAGEAARAGAACDVVFENTGWAATSGGRRVQRGRETKAASAACARRARENFQRGRRGVPGRERICSCTHKPPQPRAAARAQGGAPAVERSRQPPVTSSTAERQEKNIPGGSRSERKASTTEKSTTKQHMTTRERQASETEATRASPAPVRAACEAVRRGRRTDPRPRRRRPSRRLAVRLEARRIPPARAL